MTRPAGAPFQRLDPAARAEAAAYVATLTVELARIARSNALPTLAYLLDIARLEAETQAREPALPQSERAERAERR
ncbi:hypothetical protein JOD31_000083 [Methylopila capsulata]|uniref:Uncharacterized protein n=1 Tax=Methylopila capsulata TaxID=61654 RepID=A0A9W6IU64_9HYPH|nr:hypothetical protein [Methylopila capsulata]MBM7849871.1 hypothetical protein [Methylopila capsulata]GLK55161.1 hypothetical protein GCM10008170_11800 [Methylopila capsulata]